MKSLEGILASKALVEKKVGKMLLGVIDGGVDQFGSKFEWLRQFAPHNSLLYTTPSIVAKHLAYNTKVGCPNTMATRQCKQRRQTIT